MLDTRKNGDPQAAFRSVDLLSRFVASSHINNTQHQQAGAGKPDGWHGECAP